MIRQCHNCGKGIMRGNKVARARQELLYRSPKTFKANLHSAKFMTEDGSRVKLLLCTKCLRMLRKAAAIDMAASVKAAV